MTTTEDLRTADDLASACAALASEIATLRHRILDYGSHGMQRCAWKLEDASDDLLIEANRNYSTIRDDLADASVHELVPDFFRLDVEDNGLDCEITAVKGGILGHVAWYCKSTGEMMYYSEYSLSDASYLDLVKGKSPLMRETDTAGNILSVETARRLCRCSRTASRSGGRTAMSRSFTSTLSRTRTSGTVSAGSILSPMS